MSRTYETRTTTGQYLASVRCDLCGAAARNTRNWTSDSAYGVAETCVSLCEGKSYPEGGSGTTVEVDLCPTCFKEKLIPWLRAQGAPIEEQEWDT